MEEMELPERLPSKAERNRNIFLNAVHEVKEESIFIEKREEQISLESAYRRFIKSPHVSAYYSLVPLITEVLDNAKNVCVEHNTTMAKSFDTLARKTHNTGPLIQNKEALRQATSEINQTLETLYKQITVIMKDTMARMEIQKKDIKLLIEVVSLYWETKREEYFARSTGLDRLSKAYVLHHLLGFNVEGEKRAESYSEEWRSTVWEYLNDVDHENMQLIATLDETQRELDVLYEAMQNQVSYKSLVMLAMWRYRHNLNGKTTKSIVELIRGDGCDSDEEIGWTLAYGEFFKDYQLFMMWHRYDFEGRPVHIHLYYIDFKTSAFSRAIPIDMRREVTSSSATPFASLFVNHDGYLPLSYMVPHSSNERK